MPIWTLAAAAALTSPNLSTLLVPNDYPQWALRTDKSVAAVLEITLDPKGRVQSCTRHEFIGDEKLADSLCRIVSTRKIQAATTIDGSSSYFRARRMMTMFLPGTTSGDEVARARQGADVTVELPKMPVGVTNPVSTVTVAVDEKGQISACAEQEVSKNQVLVTGACNYTAGVSLPPLQLSDGQRVRYVSQLRIQFKAQS